MAAEIRVVGHDIESQRSWVGTDPDVGDYHRLIEAGTYDLEVSAPGYETETVNGVVVTAGPTPPSRMSLSLRCRATR